MYNGRKYIYRLIRGRTVCGDGGVTCRPHQGRAFWRLCTWTLKVCARVYYRDDSRGGGSSGDGRPWIDPTLALYGSDPFRIKLGTTRREPRVQNVDSGEKKRRGWAVRTKLFLRSVNPACPSSFAPLLPGWINNRAPAVRRSSARRLGRAKAKSSSSKVRLPPFSIGHGEK